MNREREQAERNANSLQVPPVRITPPDQLSAEGEHETLFCSIGIIPTKLLL